MPLDQYHCHSNNFVPIWYAKELIINLFWGPWPWGPCENWFCWIEALILQALVPDSYTISGLHVTRALWEMILLDEGSRRIRALIRARVTEGGEGCWLSVCMYMRQTIYNAPTLTPHPCINFNFNVPPYNPTPPSHQVKKNKSKML